MKTQHFVTLLVLVGSLVATSAPASAQKIYWHHWENGSGKIRRADLDGSNVENLIDLGSSGVGGIAVDQTGGKIYWTEEQLIRRANLDGTGAETVLVSDYPSALTIDEVNRRIYWAHGFEWTFGLSRADLDGQNAEIIGEFFPEGIDVDALAGKIYFISFHGSIFLC